MPPKKVAKAKLFTRYPASSVSIYIGATILHFLLGGLGIVLSLNFSSWPAYTLGGLYLLFSLVVMFFIMPLAVCPKCVYYSMKDGLCISGLNRFSRKVAKPGNPRDFARRSKGTLCPNNLYMASLIVPLLVMIPGLVIHYSITLLAIFIALLGLLLFRFFVIFPKIACLHCRAKFKCPQAGAMGVRNL